MSSPTILVVDDQPVNVQLLRRKLEREGIRVVAAFTGQEALEVVNKDKPDLILLDVMMPDMDGIDVCQRLQEKEETRSIPVIFITARSSKESKLEGLAVGAVDYITKPIDLDETLARVQTQLRFVAINREMVDLQRRLQEARRAATIGAVTQGIAHNLNNLLGVVLGYLDLIKTHYNKPEFVKRNADHVENAVQRIVNIIKQLTSLVGKSRLPTMKYSLQQLLRDGVTRYQSEFKITQPVAVENPLGDLEIETHIEVFEDVLSKILINAWESYGTKPPDARPIKIVTREVESSTGSRAVEIRVEDHGNGIDPEIRDHMFEPFISAKQTVGVGMGLTVARHAMRNMGGEVSMADNVNGGTVAILVHPIERKKRPSQGAGAEEN
ncbi:MAG TPA: response regulator [Opitutaceae bacterium]|nr:response regulator [Opitutaceae bacterium]